MTLSKPRSFYISLSALIIIVAIILSGPGGLIIARAMGAQSKWEGVDAYIAQYKSIEALPYVFGFMLVLGFLFLFSCLFGSGDEEKKPLAATGFALTCIYAALICFNYIVQVAFIPNALDQDKSILSFLSMTNPKSLPWSLEMFGYAILGLATLFIAPLFSNGKLQMVIKWLFVLNGAASIFGAIIFVMFPVETTTGEGFIGYILWNILIVLIMALIIIEFRFGKSPQSEK